MHKAVCASRCGVAGGVLRGHVNHGKRALGMSGGDDGEQRLARHARQLRIARLISDLDPVRSFSETRLHEGRRFFRPVDGRNVEAELRAVAARRGHHRACREQIGAVCAREALSFGL